MCNRTIVARGLATMIGHIAKEHPDIAECIFSCPCCIKVVTCTRETYNVHWETVHSSTEGRDL
jgi:hypothetical protein